jgi:hypothetical protein
MLEDRPRKGDPDLLAPPAGFCADEEGRAANCDHEVPNMPTEPQICPGRAHMSLFPALP